jgi:ABC-type transporter Mla subunit MlaD
MAERDEPPTPGRRRVRCARRAPSRGRDQAVWVGFFLVVGIIAIFAALFILTDAAFFRGRYIVSTVVTDAGGIRRGDPCRCAA